MSSRRLVLAGAIALSAGMAFLASCSSFNDDTSTTTDAGTPDASVADVADVDGGPGDASRCMDACNSHHCDDDGGCQPLVFVTDKPVGGNFGGIDGGDAFCNAEAVAAGLKQDFIALLSDSQTNALTRLTGTDSPPRMVWQSNNTEIALEYADMFGDAGALLLNPLETTASGGTVPPGQLVWTGTSGSTGAVASDGIDCGDWFVGGATTGVSGEVGQTGERWAYASENPCSGAQHLYCAEITK